MSHTATASELRAFIGPRHRSALSPYFYDWSQPAELTDYGDSFAPTAAALTSGSTAAGASTINVNTTADFPSAGGLFFKPNAAGAAFVYVEYSGKTAGSFTGVIWPPTNEIEGLTNIPAGAQLVNYLPLEQSTGAQMSQQLQITRVAAGQFAGSNWTATIQGFNVARHVAANHHIIIIQERTDPGDTWTNILTGWTTAPSYNDNGERSAPWQLTIVSSATMAERYQSKPITVGDRDIAKDGSASASNELEIAYKERYSPDFQRADPDFSAGQVLDRDPATLWIADQYVGSMNYADPATTSDPLIWYSDGWDTQAVISLIYLRRPAGYDSVGYRFIELTAIPQPPDGSTNLNDHWIHTEKADTFQLLDIGGADVEEGEKILICEDQELFNRENPLNAYKTTYEIPDQSFWDSIDPAGDTIVLRRFTPGDPYAQDTICHGVQWGNATGSMPQLDPDDGGTWSRWTGPNVAAPAPGQSIRRLWLGANGLGTSTTPADYFETAYNVIPGYTVGVYGGDPDGWNLGKFHEVWIEVEIPSLQHYLKDDIAVTVGPGQDLYIVDPDGEPNTEGLPDGPATIQIGLEQISYLTKHEDRLTINGRGMNGTDIEQHIAGDQVQYVDAGIATTAPPIAQIQWRRARTGGPYPTAFKVYTSRRADRQRHPGDERWTNDWTLRATQTNFVDNGADPDRIIWTQNYSPSIRTNRILIVITGMSEDPARPRLNEIYARVSSAEFDADTWQPTNSPAASVAAAILSGTGAIPAPAVTVYLTTNTIEQTETEAGPCYSMALDVCDYSHSYMRVTPGSRIHLEPHPWIEAASLSPAYTWQRGDLSSISVSHADPIPIKQYEMSYSTPAGVEGSAIYPPTDETPDDGSIEEIGPYIASSAAGANNSVKRRYLLGRLPYQVTIELAEGRLDIEPGSIHRIQWDFGPHEGAAPLQYNRIHIAESIDLLWNEGIVTTAISLIQADRIDQR